MSPRPAVERVQLSVRLRASAHAALVAAADRDGLSMNEAVERAVLAFAALPAGGGPRTPTPGDGSSAQVRAAAPPPAARQVVPRFKGKAK